MTITHCRNPLRATEHDQVPAHHPGVEPVPCVGVSKGIDVQADVSRGLLRLAHALPVGAAII